MPWFREFSPWVRKVWKIQKGGTTGTFIAEMLQDSMLDAVSLMFRTQYLVGAVLFASATLTPAEGIRIIAPTTFREGIRIPVRVEKIAADGSIIKEVWSRRGLLVSHVGSVPPATNEFEFQNGVAFFSVGVAGTNDVNIEVRDTLVTTTNRLITAAPLNEQIFAGALTGTSTTWSGVVRVTNDVTVPAGHTLRIEPGTLVLVDGTDSGTIAPDLLVSGTVESLGTEAQPVLITSTRDSWNWGQIRHSSGSHGSYRYTFIHRGGRTAGEGHTGTGPVLRLSGAQVRLENCMVSELWTDQAIGKGMFARDSDLVLDSTIFAQMRMGPEIEGTSLLCTNSFFMEMRGPDDCDGIYLHDAGGKSLRVVDTVFIGGDDDAIDTLDSDVTVSGCIFRGWLNESEDAKAISVFNGRVDVQRCLIADCFSGVSAKASDGKTATVFIDHSTIVTKTNGVAAAWKSNATGPSIDIHITNSIVIANPAIASSFGETNVLAGYSILSSGWPGAGISLQNPLFADDTEHNYRLSDLSPAINSGDPAAPPDEDGSRTDLGYVAFRALVANVSAESQSLALSISGLRSGQIVVTEHSIDLGTWAEMERAIATGSSYTLNRPLDGNTAVGFFRFRLE